MEELKPICRFDPLHPEMYRNSELLMAVLHNTIPAMHGKMRSEELEISNAR
jgi:hypothetical protein